MKVRNGFISNSSSSSFVVYGKSYEQDDIAKLMCKAKNIEYDEDTYYGDYEENINIFNWIEESSNFAYHDNDGTVIIGVPLTDINGDETLNQFIERVNNLFKTVLGDDNPDIELIDGAINSGGGLEY